jgi:hypothetical protein
MSMLGIIYLYSSHAIHMFYRIFLTCGRDLEGYLTANHKVIQPCLFHLEPFSHAQNITYGFKSLICIAICFPASSLPFLCCTCFLLSLVSIGRESFKPDPWQQHAGPRAWRRKDRGGGRRGRGSLYFEQSMSVLVLSVFLFVCPCLLLFLRVQGYRV